MNEQAIAAAQGRLDRALALAEQAFRDMAAYGAPDQGAEVAYLRALRRAERAAEELDCLTRAVGQGEPGRAALEALLARLAGELRANPPAGGKPAPAPAPAPAPEPRRFPLHDVRDYGVTDAQGRRVLVTEVYTSITEESEWRPAEWYDGPNSTKSFYAVLEDGTEAVGPFVRRRDSREVVFVQETGGFRDVKWVNGYGYVPVVTATSEWLPFEASNKSAREAAITFEDYAIEALIDRAYAAGLTADDVKYGVYRCAGGWLCAYDAFVRQIEAAEAEKRAEEARKQREAESLAKFQSASADRWAALAKLRPSK